MFVSLFVSRLVIGPLHWLIGEICRLRVRLEIDNYVEPAAFHVPSLPGGTSPDFPALLCHKTVSANFFQLFVVFSLRIRSRPTI